MAMMFSDSFEKETNNIIKDFLLEIKNGKERVDYWDKVKYIEDKLSEHYLQIAPVLDKYKMVFPFYCESTRGPIYFAFNTCAALIIDGLTFMRGKIFLEFYSSESMGKEHIILSEELSAYRLPPPENLLSIYLDLLIVKMRRGE